METEIQKLMDTFGFDRVQAYHHVKARRDLTRWKVLTLPNHRN